MLIGPIKSGPAVGGDGVATATGISNQPIVGFVYSLQIKYVGDPPAGTTDATIKTQGTTPAPPSITLYSKSNSATDAHVFPRFDSCKSSDGSALSTNDMIGAISDYVQITIEQANAGDSIEVWIEMIY
jgi:hypothetical protein